MSLSEEFADWSHKNTIGSENVGDERLTYSLEELRSLAEAALCAVPLGGVMAEIGVFCGRSLSILLQVARTLHATVYACDPFRWNGLLAEPSAHVIMTQFKDVDLRFTRGTSWEMKQSFPIDETIDLLHVDGDHTDVETDCRLWLPVLRPGGVAIFHDVDDDPRATYDVYTPVQKYTGDWQTLWWDKHEAGHQMCRRKPL